MCERERDHHLWSYLIFISPPQVIKDHTCSFSLIISSLSVCISISNINHGQRVPPQLCLIRRLICDFPTRNLELIRTDLGRYKYLIMQNRKKRSLPLESKANNKRARIEEDKNEARSPTKNLDADFSQVEANGVGGGGRRKAKVNNNNGAANLKTKGGGEVEGNENQMARKKEANTCDNILGEKFIKWRNERGIKAKRENPNYTPTVKIEVKILNLNHVTNGNNDLNLPMQFCEITFKLTTRWTDDSVQGEKKEVLTILKNHLVEQKNVRRNTEYFSPIVDIVNAVGGEKWGARTVVVPILAGRDLCDNTNNRTTPNKKGVTTCN